ncbi:MULTISPECIES: hypothetical protein [Nocardiopsis]|mgnify:CR=1 FL=1|uniref:Uncharacterized protein n=2 Tax=Nocardiopsis TaxID=2013 RepID=A0ABT4TRY5_9ACTN|nr:MULTISPECIES: hypothetical protein [Nocardiopsis]MDA2807436.1 hypothetical protein [Nocardiopsis suaedae]MDA2814389.1 hypothetical protein [Nocardiopsis endophytica]
MDMNVVWGVLFGLPILAIIVIIGFARYQASEVQQDGRDDRPEEE